MIALIAVLGLLATSTFSGLLRKVLFQLTGPGLHGDVHTFEKPWFTTLESLVGCWASLVVYWVIKLAAHITARRDEELTHQRQPLLTPQSNPPAAKGEKEAEALQSQVSSSRVILSLTLPAVFSAVSIVLMGYGMQYNSASLCLMLSGSCIIFTALLSILFLKRHLNAFHVSGIALTLAGVIIVSIAKLIWPDHALAPHKTPQPGSPSLHARHMETVSQNEAILGICLFTLGILFMAGRLVAEEAILGRTGMHPLEVLGYEGMWGSLLTAISLIVVWKIPGHDIGHCEENLKDTFVMLYNSRLLNGINWAFFGSTLGLNVFGLMVTDQLGSVFRAVLLTARTALVWGIDLLLFYSRVGDSSIGEAWTSPASFVQLAGFIVLLVGTIVYAQGSSAVAQAWLQSKAQDDPEDSQPLLDRPSLVNQVNRLRPYTSLYIPPSRGRRHSRTGFLDPDLHHSQSLPRDALPTGAPLSAHAVIRRSHSLSPGVPLGDTSSSLQEGLLAEAAEGSAPLPLSRSQNLFLETLTHPSSWVMPGVTPRRDHRLARQSGSGSTQGLSSTLPSFEEAAEQTGDATAPEDSDMLNSQDSPPPRSEPVIGSSSAERQRQTGFHVVPHPKVETLDIPASQLQNSGKPQTPEKADRAQRLAGRGTGGPQETESLDASQRGEVDQQGGLGGSNDTSPFVGAPDQASSSGSSNPPESRATGALFGQSPAPDLLLQRRSTGKAKPALLPAFSEEYDDPDEPASSPPLGSHQVFLDSDSDISRTGSRGWSNASRLSQELCAQEQIGSPFPAASDTDETLSIASASPLSSRPSQPDLSDSSDEGSGAGSRGRPHRGERQGRHGFMRKNSSLQWNGAPMSL